MSRVLVISPHPDDESIGCGGTLRKHAVERDEVRVVFLTSGEGGGHGRQADETVRVREQEARSAAAILGISIPTFWRGPDGALSVTHELVNRLHSDLVEWRPEVVYVTHPREMHRDHRAAAHLVRRAVSELPTGMPRPEVWMYEVWTPLQHFDRIVDVSDFMDCKLKAVRAHASQCSVMRFDEACRGLARYRGEMHSWPGGNYAEVFREWCPTGGTRRPRFQGSVSRGTS